LWKEVNGTRTFFLYADEGIVGECDATGAVTKTYGYAPDSTWTTNPLFMKVDNEYSFYHNDHLGAPQKITTTSGALVWSSSYTAFGEADIEIETVKNNLRFPGQYFDAETRLYYNYHRYYDPITGRYLTPDPIGINRKADPLYVYVQNNPVRTTDPQGLKGETVVPPEVVGEIPAAIVEMMVTKTMAGWTGAYCAAQYCKHKRIPRDYLTGPYADCISFYDEHHLPPGTPGDSQAFLAACADECWNITHKNEFKEVCCIKD
jgi:RHS repeat-associated protein